MIHPKGSIPARRRSACRSAASFTGVVSASVTMSTRVNAGSRSRMSGVVTCPGIVPLLRMMSRWYAPVRSSSKQGVAGGCGVDDDVLVAAETQQVRERLEDREFFGAWRAQVFFEQRALFGIEPACGSQFVVDVVLHFGVWVDPADGESGRRVGDEVGWSARRICCREVGSETVVRESLRDGNGDRRLTDASLAHHHDHARARLYEFSDERVEVRDLRRLVESSVLFVEVRFVPPRVLAVRRSR